MHAFHKISVEEKHALIKWFEHQPEGAKLKKQTPVDFSSDLGACSPTKKRRLLPHFSLKNSIIKINGELYQIATGHNGLIGKGQFGKVKYVQHLFSAQRFALKVERFKPKEDNEQKLLKESAINKDVNLSIGSAVRFNEPGAYKHYSLMHYQGIDLRQTLNKKTLNDEQRFDVAIQLCFEVYKLHSGLLSNTATRYTHQDIKPANISITPSLHPTLIDYGLSKQDPLAYHTNIIASPIYMPALRQLAKGNLTEEQIDLFALKRTLYMPNIARYLFGLAKDETGNHHGHAFLLPEKYAENTPLSKYINTGGEINNNAESKLTAFSLAALLVLSKYQAPASLYPIVAEDHHLAALALAYYFIQKQHFEKNFRAKLIAGLLYQHHKLKQFNSHKSGLTMNHSQKKALLISHGLDKNIEEACQHQPLILLLASNQTTLIKQAAIILFQLAILDETPIMDNDFIDILQQYPELSPMILELYNNDKHAQIIATFLAPVNIPLALRKLSKANDVLALFKINKCIPLLTCLLRSPSPQYTKALLFLFEIKNTFSKQDSNALNGFRIDAINFLITHVPQKHQHEHLVNFIMKGNNALVFHGIERLVHSKLLPNAKKMLPVMINAFIENAAYVQLIKSNPTPKPLFIAHYLTTLNITPKAHVNDLFINEKAIDVFFSHCKEQSLPRSLVKKIMQNPQTMHAYMHLCDKDVSAKGMMQELKSDIRISQINEKHSLVPLSYARVFQKLEEGKPLIAPSVRKRHSSFSDMPPYDENESSQQNAPNQWSEKIKSAHEKKEPNKKKPTLASIKLRPQSHKIAKKNCPNDHYRNRMFNPMTHQKQAVAPTQEKPKIWRL